MAKKNKQAKASLPILIIVCAVLLYYIYQHQYPCAGNMGQFRYGYVDSYSYG